MNARVVALLGVGFVALVAACSASPAPILDEAGDPCRGRAQRCVDDQTVLRCDGQILVETDCDEVCAELGPAWVADGCGSECACVPADPEGCWPGERGCVDAQTLERCDDEQRWETVACADLCAAAGLSSVGCVERPEDSTGADCWCSGEGTACDPSTPPVCVDEGSIAQCEGGVWSFYACTEICGAPSSCVPWESPASCAC